MAAPPAGAAGGDPAENTDRETDTMAFLLLIPLAVMAVLIGQNLGWRWVLAPLIVYAVLRWALASLRVLRSNAHGMGAQAEDAGPVGPDEQVLYRCEECETEVLLLVRGSGRAPSHCGQRMHERSVLPSDN